MNQLPRDSRFKSELFPEDPKMEAWGTQLKTNLILADIWDMLAQINANLVAIGSGDPAKKVKPYPRPVPQKPENEQHYGRGALPADELHKWIEGKRAEYAGSSKCDP